MIGLEFCNSLVYYPIDLVSKIGPAWDRKHGATDSIAVYSAGFVC